MPQSDVALACLFVLDVRPTRSEASTYSTPFVKAGAGLAVDTGQLAAPVHFAR